MSLLNGETVPQAVQPGDMIYTGTINLSAPLTAVIEKAGEDSMLAGIVRLMEQAEQGRAKYVMLADKAARLYTPVVHTLAAGAFIGWLFIGGIAWQDALLIAVTTLIITCPCALGLAVPVVQVLTSGWLMKHGILLKSGDALERLSSVDTVVFDKTGTLTVDVPQLQEAPQDPALLQLAASLATHSRHPLAQALAAGFDGSLLTAEAVEEVPAHGMQAVIDGRSLRLGRRDWCGDALAQDSGMPELWLAEGEVPLAVFRFAAPVKDGAVELITRLKAQGMQLHLLSGDREAVVRQTAQELGMEAWKAACLPADKTAFIQQLRDSGRTVLMVGDGLNDAPALAAADVSIAPSGGVDITQNSADLIVQGNRLLPVLDALRMAKVSTKRVKENFALAVLYNCCAIPLAVAGYVTPLVAAIAMSSSSLLVIANSFRINLERPER
jgi:Cu2+-exporting ATPase